MKLDLIDEEKFQKCKQIIFEEAMGSGTLGTPDINTDSLTYSLIPYLVWKEISLGAQRSQKLSKAVFMADISGESGNTIHVPVLGRDEFTAQTISEETLDADGYTKTKLSPDSVKLEIGDVIYNATKLSDILQEDSKLPWARASLQKMGEAIAYKIEQDIEAVLYANAGTVVGCGGTLTYEKVVEAKKELKKLSYFDDPEPFLLLVNPDSEEDLITQDVTNNILLGQRLKEGGLEDFYGSPIYAGCVGVVSEHIRDNFGYLMVAPINFQSASVMFAWKRKLKRESWRDEQYGRDVFLLSTRYAVGSVQSKSVVLLSAC